MRSFDETAGAARKRIHDHAVVERLDFAKFNAVEQSKAITTINLRNDLRTCHQYSLKRLRRCGGDAGTINAQL